MTAAKIFENAEAQGPHGALDRPFHSHGQLCQKFATAHDYSLIIKNDFDRTDTGQTNLTRLQQRETIHAPAHTDGGSGKNAVY
jgi:hypothetical protein